MSSKDGAGVTRREYSEDAEYPRVGMTLAELQGFCRRAELAGVEPTAVVVIKTNMRAAIKFARAESVINTTAANLDRRSS